MKIKLVLAAIFASLLIVVTFMAMSKTSVAAKEISLPEILELPQAEIHVSEGYEAPLPESMAGSEPIPASQLVSNEQLVLEAMSLIEKAAQTFLVPGWLHIVSSTEDFFAESAVLPDGSPVPTGSMNESWILLDHEGFAVQIVTIDDTGDPRTTQTSVYQNGVWTNLSMGTSIQDTDKFRPTLDSNFVGLVTTYSGILEIEKADGALEGQSVSVYAITEMFKEPTSYAGSSEAVLGTVRKFYFSNETGVLLRLERYSIMTNGNLVLIRQIDTLLIERIEFLPSDVANLLSK